MRKFFAVIFFLILITTGLGTVAYMNSAYLLAKVISNKIHLPVSIKALDFYEKHFSIRNLKMANPPEARIPIGLKVEAIDITAPYTHYIKNPIVIDKIHMNDLHINIQFYNKERTNGNWHTIIKNIKQKNETPLSFEREVVVKKLLFTQIYIDLILSNGKIYHLPPIEKIEFKNITTKKGIPIQEISKIIVEKMVHSIFLEKSLQAIIKTPVDIIKKIFPFVDHTPKNPNKKN